MYKYSVLIIPSSFSM